MFHVLNFHSDRLRMNRMKFGPHEYFSLYCMTLHVSCSTGRAIKLISLQIVMPLPWQPACWWRVRFSTHTVSHEHTIYTGYHYIYLCRVADTRTAIHKTNVDYMYTIPTYVGGGQMGYKSTKCSYSGLIHHDIWETVSCWYVEDRVLRGYKRNSWPQN